MTQRAPSVPTANRLAPFDIPGDVFVAHDVPPLRVAVVNRGLAPAFPLGNENIAYNVKGVAAMADSPDAE